MLSKAKALGSLHTDCGERKLLSLLSAELFADCHAGLDWQNADWSLQAAGRLCCHMLAAISHKRRHFTAALQACRGAAQFLLVNVCWISACSRHGSGGARKADHCCH